MSTLKPTQGTKVKSTCMLLNKPRRIPLRRTLVVLGVERGGTSMVAGILRALGVPMGERAGLNHEDPGFLRDDPEQLLKVIKTRNRQFPMWGFKVPKASLMLPFYEENLRTPFYVVVYRNPLSIVDSWQQRGAGDLTNVLDRIGTYQSAILELARTSKAPILFVNYERAVADDASKLQVVQECAAFAGIDLTDELTERATSMMTGDGKGYVNLPEHSFLVEPGAPDGARSEIPLKELEPEHRGPDGWVEADKPRPKLIYAMSTGENLPKRFWLDVDLDAQGTDLSQKSIRFFFNFMDAYFPGHCARPPVQVGRNRYWVETSGHAKAIGFSVIKPPARLNITARAYAATDADSATPVEETRAAATEMAGTGILSQTLGKIRGNG